MKFFILGLGSIGIRHARNLLTLGHEVCGYDLLPEKFIQAREELGIPIEVPGRDNMDAYVICTPSSEHYDNMVEAVRLGKHFFVEKPLSDVRQIVQGGLPELLEEAKRKNLVVMVGNMLRFHPEVRRMKPLIKNPTTAHFLVLQRNNRTDYRRDGVLLNWGAHEIDLACYFLGPAEVVRSVITPESANIGLQHSSGATSTISMDYLTDPEIREFEVREKNGTLHDVDLRLPDWNDVYMDEMREFVYHIQHVKESWRNWWGATGDDGLAILKIIAEAMRRADVS